MFGTAKKELTRIELADQSIENFNSLLKNAEAIEAVRLINEGATLTISSDEQAELAKQLGLDLKAVMSDIEEALNPEIEKANEYHKTLTAERNTYVKPIKTVIDKLKLAVGNYNLEKKKEQDRIAEEKRKADEAEKKRIEEENKKNADLFGQKLAESAENGLPPPEIPTFIELPEMPKIAEYTPPPTTTKGTTIAKEPVVVDATKVPAYYPEKLIHPSELMSMIQWANNKTQTNIIPTDEWIRALASLLNDFMSNTPPGGIEIRTIDMAKLKALYKLNPQAEISGVEVKEVAKSRW